MSYGDHIDGNTGQKCDCSLAISGGHYRGRAETDSLSHSCPTCKGNVILGIHYLSDPYTGEALPPQEEICPDCNPQPQEGGEE